MMTLFNKHFLKAGGLLAALLVTLLTPGVGQAGQVNAGYDLFTTGAPTYFITPGGDINLQGVPIGTCAAGSCGSGSVTPAIPAIPNGTYVGNTDTIVLRTNAVTTDGGLTGLAIQALQLVSTNTINFANFGGSGVGYLYVTLATSPPALTGPNPDPTTGLAPNTMQINGATTGSGTFSSYLDFYVNLYESPNANGSGGTLVNNLFNGGQGSTPIEEQFLSKNVSWSNIPNIALLIPNINYKLNGSNTTSDFYPNLPFTETAPNGVHTVAPEPSTFALLGAGFALFGYSRRKTIRSKLNAA